MQNTVGGYSLEGSGGILTEQRTVIYMMEISTIGNCDDPEDMIKYHASERESSVRDDSSGDSTTS